jgi:exonuclease III
MPTLTRTTNENTDDPKKRIRILQWNANGIWSKMEQIETLMKDTKADIVILNEIQLHNDQSANFLFKAELAKNYDIEYKRRAQGKGGGVAMLISKKLRNEPIKEKDMPKDIGAEVIGATVYLGTKITHIFSYYEAPEKPLKEKIFAYAESLGDHLIIGDFNAKMKPYDLVENERGKTLSEILTRRPITLLNESNKPTYYHHRDNNTTYTSTLDLALGSNYFVNNFIEMNVKRYSAVSQFQKLQYHEPVVFEFKSQPRLRISRTQGNKSFIYGNVKWEKFENECDRLFIDEYDNEISLDDLAKKIGNTLKEAASNTIPQGGGKETKTSYPPLIHDLIKYKKQRQKIFNFTRDETTAKLLKEAQIMVGEALDRHACQQWSDFLEKLGPHPLSTAPFWKRINRLRGTKKRKNIESLINEGIEIKDSKMITKIFADRLEGVFHNETNSNFNEIKRKEVEDFVNHEKYNSQYMDSEKSDVPIGMNDLSRALKSLNTKTSIDQDGIANRMLKHVTFIGKEKILFLFNRCLGEKKLPSHWKQSQVTMILKPNQDSKSASSYRPISITPCLARLFEKILLDRVQKHLQQKKILIDQQSGFRRARQTRDNIFLLTQKARQGFNEKKQTLAIFFDITAAFDKVWHAGLLYKLAKIKLPYYLLVMIKEFLSGRTFIVKIENTLSETKRIRAGVPQGAVLSPTLFSIYINDVPKRNGGNSTHKEYTALFADDINYVCTYKSTDKENVTLIAQKYLDELEMWVNDWRLRLAPHKCSQLVMTRNKKTGGAQNLDIKICGEKINSESAPKYLGVLFDKYLCFKNQMAHIKEKTSERLNIIKILSYSSNMRLNTDTLIKIYKILVRSIIEYSCLLVNLISNTEMEALEAIQCNALRIIFKKSLNDRIKNEDLRAMANVESIKERLQKLSDKYFEKAICTFNPMIDEIIEDYGKFRNRNHKNPSLAMGNPNILNIIEKHNFDQIETKEKVATIMCGLEWAKEYQSDTMPWH